MRTPQAVRECWSLSIQLSNQLLSSFRVGQIARMANFGVQESNYAFLPVDSELSQTSSIRTFKIPVEKWNSSAEKHTIGFSEQVSSVILCLSLSLSLDHLILGAVRHEHSGKCPDGPGADDLPKGIRVL